METVDQIGDIFLMVATVGINLFIIIYSLNKPWRKSAVGVQLFLFVLSLVVIMDLVWLFRYWDHNEMLEEWLELFLFGCLAASIWWFTIGLIRARLRQLKLKK